MDEIQKAKTRIILNIVGFSVGVTTFLVETIPIIAIGAIIFCPIDAVRTLRKYRELKRLQLEPSVRP